MMINKILSLLVCFADFPLPIYIFFFLENIRIASMIHIYS